MPDIRWSAAIAHLPKTGSSHGSLQSHACQSSLHMEGSVRSIPILLYIEHDVLSAKVIYPPVQLFLLTANDPIP